MRLGHMTNSAHTHSITQDFILLLLLKMAEDREPAARLDASHARFSDPEDGEDLFVSAVSKMEVRCD